MKRREFITLLGGAAAWPLAARAQQPAMPVVGYLGADPTDLSGSRVRGLHQGLGETGHVEGRNVAVEYLWAEGRNDRLPALAVDFVRRRVNVIIAPGNAAALAAKAATTTIPIVYQGGNDPVALGLAASLNKPGGNITGVTTLGGEVAPKRLELMRELVPTANVIGHLVNPQNPTSADVQTKDLQTAARALGVELHNVNASADADLEAVFAALARLRAGALVVAPDSFLLNRTARIAGLALRHAMPAIYQNREFVAAGGLLSYGSNSADAMRLAGVYVGRILKGEKPADLPIQQATKVELFVNLKTAKALSITVPTALLVRADEVIE